MLAAVLGDVETWMVKRDHELSALRDEDFITPFTNAVLREHIPLSTSRGHKEGTDTEWLANSYKTA